MIMRTRARWVIVAFDKFSREMSSMKFDRKIHFHMIKKCRNCPVENPPRLRNFHKFSPRLSHTLWRSLWTFLQSCGKNRDFQGFFGALPG